MSAGVDNTRTALDALTAGGEQGVQTMAEPEKTPVTEEHVRVTGVPKKPGAHVHLYVATLAT